MSNNPMTPELMAELREWLDVDTRRDVGRDDGIAMMDTIDAQAAEIADCEANINLKADFIEDTLNQLAEADETIARLREALGESFMVSVADFGKYYMKLSVPDLPTLDRLHDALIAARANPNSDA